MLYASEEFKERVQQTADVLFKATLTLADGTVRQIVGDDVDFGSVQFNDAVSSNGSFDVGAAIVSQLVLTLNNRDRRFDTYRFGGASIVPYVGVQLGNGNVEWLIKGIYYVEQPKSYGSTIKLTCYDSLKLLDRDYKDVKTQYPATLGKIIADICDFCGITLLTKTFQNFGYTVNARPTDENLTCAEMMANAAQVAGCFVDADQLGRLRVRWYDETAFGEESGLDGGTFNTSTRPYSDGDAAFGGWFMYGGDTFNGGAFYGASYVSVTAIRSYTVNTDDKQFTGLMVTAAGDGYEDGEEYLAGSDGYIMRIESNPLVERGRAREVADMLSGQIVGMEFRPLDVQEIGDPTIEAGDAVQVVDRLARVYRTWATQVTWSATGTTRITCAAEEESTVAGRRRRTNQGMKLDQLKLDLIDGLGVTVPTIIERNLPDIIINNPQIRDLITDIAVPEISPTVPVINGLDGLDYVIGVDENGAVTANLVPSIIKVTVPPNKTNYKYGEMIDYSGIVVTLYDAKEQVFDSESYPNGVIPFDELIFPDDIAKGGSESAGNYYSDGKGINALHVVYDGPTIYPPDPFYSPETFGKTALGFIKQSYTIYDLHSGILVNDHPESFDNTIVTSYNGKIYFGSLDGSKRAGIMLYKKVGDEKYELLYNAELLGNWYNTGYDAKNIPISTVEPTGKPTGLESIEKAQNVPVKWNNIYTGTVLEASFKIVVNPSGFVNFTNREINNSGWGGGGNGGTSSSGGGNF